MTKRYFERGGRGVFKCEICGRNTRRTDQGADSELCSECWELAGIDNAVNDNGPATLGDYVASRDNFACRHR
jgi:hypothetical protein